MQFSLSIFDVYLLFEIWELFSRDDRTLKRMIIDSNYQQNKVEIILRFSKNRISVPV